jgi:hypothetical protein
MVQFGSRVDQCAACLELKVCGEFWNIDPRFRVFWCADCIERMAAGVRAAASRIVAPKGKT